MNRFGWIAFALLVGGCEFQVAGVPIDASAGDDLPLTVDLGADSAVDLALTDGSVDLASADLASRDLASRDLAQVDLAQADLATSPDLSSHDLATNPDLTAPPDMGLIYPSHVAYHYLNDSSMDWTITANTVFDTGAATLAAAVVSGTAAPAGVQYTIDAGGYAVVALRNFSVGNATGSTVRFSVRGSRPLIIVAGGSITVHGVLDAGGHGATAGPFGGGPSAGTGAGGDGAVDGAGGSGGAGAGYGTSGANGGDGRTMAGPTAGGTYGTTTLVNLVAGSGGGNGSAPTGGNGGCTKAAAGGAGGGVLQLSARVAITVEAWHAPIIGGANYGGIISVSGGAGGGGCGGDTVSGSGAGGGSGGGLLVEAPSVNIAGTIAAAGGGAGGGGNFVNVAGGFTNNGSAGNDGLDLNNWMNGSGGGNGTTLNNNGGGQGSNGLVNVGNAAVGGKSSSNTAGSGGSGGGYGRLYVRSSGAATIANQTPNAVTDTSLPATIP